MSEPAPADFLFRALLEATRDAILITDAARQIVAFNDEFIRLWKLARESVTGAEYVAVLQLIAGNLAESELFLEQNRDLEHANQARTDELRLRDGRIIERTVRPSTANADLTCLTWIYRDVTLERRASEVLARWNSVVETADDAILTQTLDGKVTSWNKGAERVFGYESAEITGKSISLLIPADRREEDGVIVDRITRSERVEHYETERIRKGGARIFVSITASPLLDAAGRVTGVSKIVRDVSDRRRAEQAVFRLAAIVDSSDDAIISKDLNGRITSWNAGAERLFGYTAEEAIGRPITMLFPSDLIDEENTILARIRNGERINHYLTERVRKDGTRCPLSITVSPVKDATGKIIGASKIARDVTELRRHEQERDALLESERSARSQAELANRLKDEFLATVSHELRTPLNAILGWSQLLATAKSVDDLAEGLDVIQRNARIQAQLIEDLLDMSRIISGKVRLDVQWVDLTEVIRAATESVRPAADAKSIVLRSVLDTHAGPVAGDPARLQQIFWNLLSNAIKFTPKGGKVDVYLERVNSHLEIAVRDTGVGIKAEFLPIVFDRFRQADASTTRRFGGLGLGLAIVKHLVELHGGTVSVKSAGEGQGSTFIVQLPLAPVLERAKREHPTAPKAPRLNYAQIDLSHVKVLLVDDEPDARALVTRLLAECQATVHAAAGADEALAALAAFQPNVLISDIGMPGKDGYEFIREVRGRDAQQGGATPAIALTAFARSEDRTQALLAGYQMHVTKPIEPQELLVTVFSLAQRSAHHN